MKLADNVTIITGGGKGVGYGIAQAFAQEGSNLVITGRHEETLKKAKENLEKDFGIKVAYFVADGGNQEEVNKVVEGAVKEFGKINTLINNAQASASGVMLADHSKEQFDLAIDTGLYATFYYMKACYPYLKETKGSVINLASGAGISGKPGQSSYAAAKEGVRGMSRVAATEWAKDGVRVNVILPLAMTEQLTAWKQAYPDVFAKTIQGIPLGRFGDPKNDIGRPAVFLASEDASYVTGQCLELQGGAGLRP
ncbi:MAG: SDR family oxidoreductase [Bacilli bacterium]